MNYDINSMYPSMISVFTGEEMETIKMRILKNRYTDTPLYEPTPENHFDEELFTI